MTTPESTTPRSPRKEGEPAAETTRTPRKRSSAPTPAPAAPDTQTPAPAPSADAPAQRTPAPQPVEARPDTPRAATENTQPRPVARSSAEATPVRPAAPRPAAETTPLRPAPNTTPFRPAAPRPGPYQDQRPAGARPGPYQDQRPPQRPFRPAQPGQGQAQPPNPNAPRPAGGTNRPPNARIVSGIAAEGPQQRPQPPRRLPPPGETTIVQRPDQNRNIGTRDRRDDRRDNRDNRSGNNNGRPGQRPQTSGIGNRVAPRGGMQGRGAPIQSGRAGTPPTAPRKPEKLVIVEIPSRLTVKELADRLTVGSGEVIKTLMGNGMMATINQMIDYDTAAIVATDLGFETKEVLLTEQMVGGRFTNAAIVAQLEAPDAPEKQKPRPPVVTIMGHVDHGKTSLLDSIRSANVAAGEAGGITQHIGAYQVEIHGQKITFLDTPGHEAFTAMRARGAQVTDIAIIVVAADDGVMPQSIEAIDHARAAKVPIIIAMNKIDKPDANPDRVKQQLSDKGVLVEDWGGDVPCVHVSAKTGTNIEGLLEMILLVAELQELKADPERPALGHVVEAELDKSRGPMATVLIKNGTLKVGEVVVVGPIFGKIRAMLNDKNKPIRKADPSAPAVILGLEDVPRAGDSLMAVPDEKIARQIAMERMRVHQAESGDQELRPVSLEAIFNQIQEGQVKELAVILKSDVQGSIEAIQSSLERLSTEQVKVNIIHSSTGSITESDVMLARASKAIIIGFNTRTEPGAKRTADTEKVDIREYNIIYNLVDDVKKALGGLLEPTIVEVTEGHAEVRQVYKINRDTIGGCAVTDGHIVRNMQARVVRGGTVVHEGRVTSLKRFKDDAREVLTGYECGISVDGFALEPGDIIECFSKSSVTQTLD